MNTNNDALYNKLDDILNNNYSKLDLYIIIEEKTNFNNVKLKLLLQDTEMYLNIEREEMFSKFTDDEIEKAIEDYNEKNGIPEKIIIKGKNGLTTNYIPYDYEKMLYPYHFYNIYLFINLIKSEIENKITHKDTLSKKVELRYFSLSKLKIDTLFTKLEYYKYIDCKLNIFNKIFSGNIIDENFKKIDWKGSFASFKLLIKLLPLNIETDIDRFKICENIFTIKGKDISTIQLQRNNTPPSKNDITYVKTIINLIDTTK